MFGIVLWRSPDSKSAVVWCEDHGDLAFFRSGTSRTTKGEICLEAGDLLQFDLSEFGEIRLVEDPHLIEEEHYPCLARRLREAGGGVKSAREMPQMEAQAGTNVGNHGRTVVPFPGKFVDDREQPRSLRLS
ncbi:hypothetical protein PSAL_006360 [Pseudooceanicola algae]|uniref:Uncharacterized protein n=2 Tax=Pseudooceanicola algae TaxID=1537215 RepID=A0A418SDH8_9RHOB|nr:hypothetical protein PSAL_006360 [Pseudooceanicola algae]